MMSKKDIFKNPPKWIKNEKPLPEEYTEIVNKVLKKTARKEALLILTLAEDKEREEFREYYLKEQENNCCNSLDFFKYILFKNNLIDHKKQDFFGHLYFSFEKGNLK
jgi:uncharacterized protein YnzC (UPF0291/DUF896 family)